MKGAALGGHKELVKLYIQKIQQEQNSLTI